MGRAIKRALDDASKGVPCPDRPLTFKEPLPITRPSRVTTAAGGVIRPPIATCP